MTNPEIQIPDLREDLEQIGESSYFEAEQWRENEYGFSRHLVPIEDKYDSYGALILSPRSGNIYRLEQYYKRDTYFYESPRKNQFIDLSRSEAKVFEGWLRLVYEKSYDKLDFDWTKKRWFTGDFYKIMKIQVSGDVLVGVYLKDVKDDDGNIIRLNKFDLPPEKYIGALVVRILMDECPDYILSKKQFDSIVQRLVEYHWKDVKEKGLLGKRITKNAIDDAILGEIGFEEWDDVRQKVYGDKEKSHIKENFRNANR